MAASFFFYDLETTGVDPRRSRIMQFAGQRTDADLNPIGKPYNILIRISDDVLPDPDAILLTGITPQKTLEEGITEAEFTKLFMAEIAIPDTTFVGFNNIRFDDEFMRFLLYRNYYDPYEWQWKDGRSRWDLLDVTRITRALRPEGIEWPFDENGKCTNRLELLTKENKLLHDAAHDALSDVNATIAVGKLIKEKQPKIFDYLYSMRNKKEVIAMISRGLPFVYSSGRYPSEYLKTTVAYSLGPHPSKQGVLVYDLRHDPAPFLKMDVAQLVDAWKYTTDKEPIRLPVKAMQFNRAPAIAPLTTLDKASMERLQIDMDKIKKHRAMLDADPDFFERLRDAVDVMNKSRADQSVLFSDLALPDEQLYEAFIGDLDKRTSEKLLRAEPQELSDFTEEFRDERLRNLLPLYKARNYPKLLTGEEREAWEEHRRHVLMSGGETSRLAAFSKRLNELATQDGADSNKQYLIEELRLYAESIIPEI